MSSDSPASVLRRVSPLFAVVVILLVFFTWFATWSTSDLVTSLVPSPELRFDDLRFPLFFLLILLMMVAMMLPSSLPMMITFHNLGAKTEGGIGSTVAFMSAYFFVWTAFGAFAMIGANVLSLLWSSRILTVIPPLILVLAGVYQFTQLKETCLAQCQSPITFLMTHLRGGRIGHLRMGLVHASYCLGCCWLFMVALFVTGAMSLFWMGVLSIAIFLEKFGTSHFHFSRVVGAIVALVGLLTVFKMFIG